MIGILIFALLALEVWVVVTAINADEGRREERERREAAYKIREADQVLAREHRKARQQMNDAAGKSWRNPFE